MNATKAYLSLKALWAGRSGTNRALQPVIIQNNFVSIFEQVALTKIWVLPILGAPKKLGTLMPEVVE